MQCATLHSEDVRVLQDVPPGGGRGLLGPVAPLSPLVVPGLPPMGSLAGLSDEALAMALAAAGLPPYRARRAPDPATHAHPPYRASVRRAPACARRHFRKSSPARGATLYSEEWCAAQVVTFPGWSLHMQALAAALAPGGAIGPSGYSQGSVWLAGLEVRRAV
jgi:hypothetical protein